MTNSQNILYGIAIGLAFRPTGVVAREVFVGATCASLRMSARAVAHRRARAVMLGRANLALFESPLAVKEFDIAAYAEDELVLISSKKHPFAQM